MKKRKIVSLVLATVLGASMVLGGCGSKGGSDASNTEGASGESKGKITIFQQKTEIYDQLKELAKDYEKETGVEVEVWQISGDDYYQNLKTYPRQPLLSPARITVPVNMTAAKRYSV